MFSGKDATTGKPLATGKEGEKIIDRTRFNNVDMQFIRDHCVVIEGQDTMEEGRNCCKLHFKMYCGIVIVVGILAFIIYYYI